MILTPSLESTHRREIFSNSKKLVNRPKFRYCSTHHVSQQQCMKMNEFRSLSSATEVDLIIYNTLNSTTMLKCLLEMDFNAMYELSWTQIFRHSLRESIIIILNSKFCDLMSFFFESSNIASENLNSNLYQWIGIPITWTICVALFG